MHTAEYWIGQLNLQAHPEGGFFREFYRSADELQPPGLPARFPGARSAATSIFYLLRGREYSAFHRLRLDELWHFHTGTSALEVHVLESDGAARILTLGPSPEEGQHLAGHVSAGLWFAARCADPDGYALAGCTVAPGFSFEDFELAERDALLRQYPQHRELIASLTRA